MSDQNQNEVPKDLISDAEFVALIEQELQGDKSLQPEDALLKQRLWQKLQTSMAVDPIKAKKIKIWPWLVAAVLLLGLSPWLLKQQQPEHSQWKSGNSKTLHPIKDMTIERNESGSAVLTLHPTEGTGGHLAVVWAVSPFEVLWQGPTPAQAWQVPLPADRLGQICAISAQDQPLLEKQMEIIRALQEIPSDATCTRP